jgi:hypothetical protein
VGLREHKHGLRVGLAQRGSEEGYRVGWEEAGILEIVGDSGCGKYKESAHMACLAHPIGQPGVEFCSIGSLLSTSRSPDHREGRLMPPFMASF